MARLERMLCISLLVLTVQCGSNDETSMPADETGNDDGTGDAPHHDAGSDRVNAKRENDAGGVGDTPSRGDAGTAPNGDAGGALINEIWEKLAAEVGCGPQESLPRRSAECEAAFVQWVECVEQDTSQCLCEAEDDDLNCEGSFKPDEGPALCIEEATLARELCEG